MAIKKKSPDKYVDPLYSRNSGNAPILPTAPATMPTRRRGAGDPNYIKNMIKSGISKPQPKR